MEKSARYLDIARDIGEKIINEYYKEGDILRGRSILASEYNVSPETIRKTMNILSKEKVVTVKRGVGIFINPKFNAESFISKIGRVDALKESESKVKKLLDEQKRLDDSLHEEVKKLLDSYRFSRRETIEFLELNIPSDSWVINHSIGDIYFYNYTEATIVAVVRDDKTFTSPGPDFVIEAEDTLLLVSKDELSYERALAYITFGAGED